MLIYSSPQLIAVSHVLLRLLMPRHSPYALLRLNLSFLVLESNFELLEFRKQIRFLLVTHWKSFLCSFRNLESFSTFRWNCTLPFTGKTYLISFVRQNRTIHGIRLDGTLTCFFFAMLCNSHSAEITLASSNCLAWRKTNGAIAPSEPHGVALIKSVLFLSVRFTLQYTLFGFQWTYSVKPLGFTGRPGWTRTIDLTLIRRAL